MNEQLSDNRKFLLGTTPAAVDAQLYHVVWFLRGRWNQGSNFLSEFDDLLRWEKNIEAIGHGSMLEMSPEDAIKIAKDKEPITKQNSDAFDPQGLKPGMRVTVSPDLDGGEQPVEGEVVATSANTITLLRKNTDIGYIGVHFPREGYRVDILK